MHAKAHRIQSDSAEHRTNKLFMSSDRICNAFIVMLFVGLFWCSSGNYSVEKKKKKKELSLDRLITERETFSKYAALECSLHNTCTWRGVGFCRGEFGSTVTTRSRLHSWEYYCINPYSPSSWNGGNAHFLVCSGRLNCVLWFS